MILTRLPAIAIVLFATVAAAQPAARPSSPDVETPPVWTRTLQMPDGRTFVSDGGLAVDAEIVKPASLPQTVIPPSSSKIVAGHLTAPHKTEIALADLRPGARKNTFVGPGDISVNGNYVTLLRRTASRARLRFRGNTDPITIVVDERSVGVLMPLAPPR